MTKRQAYWVMTPRRAYWMLAIITATIYGAMAIWTFPGITNGAGGLTPFDQRYGGYTTDDARAFLGGLNLQGRILYVGPQYVLGMFFPALLAMVLAGAVQRLVTIRALKWALFAAIIIGMIANYTENNLITALLKNPDPATDAAVLMASRATVIKSVMTGFAMAGLAITLVLTFFRNRKTP